MVSAKQQKQLDDLHKKLEVALAESAEAQRDLRKAEADSVGVRRERGFDVTQSYQVREHIHILRQSIEQLQLEIAAKERAAEEIQERLGAEMQVHRQKVKHLMYDQRKQLASAELERAKYLERQGGDYSGVAKGLESEATRLQGEYMTNQGHHSMQQRQQRDEYDRQTQRLRENYETRLREVADEHARNIEEIIEDYELQRINELHEIQERKDHHIRRLMKSHDLAFARMKKFYNDITREHLHLISQHEAELRDMDIRQRECEQKKKDYEREIAELSRQLAEKQKQDAILTKTLSTYESDKMALANARARLKRLDLDIEAMKAAKADREGRYRSIQQERERLVEKFELSINDVQQKTEFRALLVQRRVETLQETVQRQEGQLDELQDAAGITDVQLSALSGELAAVIEQKNAQIRDLEYQLVRAIKSHNDTITVHQAKLLAAGVPADEVDFGLLPGNTTVAPAPQRFR